MDFFPKQLYRTLNDDHEIYEQEIMIQMLSDSLKNNDYWFVFTYNFTPDISIACENMNIPYVTWTYDSPLLFLHTKQIKKTHNFMFVFDRGEYELLRRKFNPEHLYHLPLAANSTRIGGTVIYEEDLIKFGADISYVGNMTRSDGPLDSLLNHNKLPADMKAVLQEAEDYYINMWGKESIYDFFDKKICDKIRPFIYFDPVVDYKKTLSVDVKERILFGEMLFDWRIANRGRKKMLNSLADFFAKKYSIVFYGPKAEISTDIEQRGKVDYAKEFAKVANLSKVNLHLSPPGIQTGISLRCFDVMASGGFLMANYREELVEHFEPDKDFVLFESVDELIDKVDYYLTHEDERVKIAISGHDKVLSAHTVIHRANFILDILKKEL